MENNSNNGLKELEEGINVRELVFRFLGEWPIFLGSVFIGLLIAFFVNRYSDVEYEVESVVLIETDNKSDAGIAQLMSAIGYYNPRLTFENEVIVLESYALVERTIKNLDFEVSYLEEGRVKSIEVYDSKPIRVEFQSDHIQPVNTKFTIKSLEDNDKFKLNLKDDNLAPYLYDSTDYYSGKMESLDFDQDKEFRFGEWIESNYFKFKVHKTPFWGQKDRENQEVQFYFNDLETLVNYYLESIEIAPTAEGSSGVTIKLTSSNPSKAKAFIDQFNREYLALGLEAKNQIADNTIKFISSELQQIEDSLAYIEGIMQSFLSENKIIDLSEEGKEIFSRLFDLESERADQEIRNKYYNYIYEYLEGDEGLEKIIAPSSMGVEDPLLIQLIANLSELYVKKNSLEIGLTDINPEVVQIESKIASEKAVFEGEPQKHPS